MDISHLTAALSNGERGRLHVVVSVTRQQTENSDFEIKFQRAPMKRTNKPITWLKMNRVSWSIYNVLLNSVEVPLSGI